jgi:hypothetical protein
MSRRDDIRAAVEKHEKPIPKTTKGKAEYNRKNNANLQAPQSSGPRHDSFCARSAGWTGERGKAARARWKC